MLEQLSVLPPDPILGLAAACRADPNPDKIDLTVGVYMDEDGICPVFEAVKQAQAALVAEEVTKAYLPAAGDMDYLTGMKTLVFGEELAGDGRISRRSRRWRLRCAENCIRGAGRGIARCHCLDQ